LHPGKTLPILNGYISGGNLINEGSAAMVNYLVLALIFVDVILNVAGQLSLKYGMSQFGNFSLSLGNLPPIFLKAATNPNVLLGLLCYGLGFLVWLIVLAKAEVSYAYPLISLGYVFTAILARFLFGEAVSFTRMAGILVTCAGVFLIARS
jgi:multidrug transporter EmrE-like cation transporter